MASKREIQQRMMGCFSASLLLHGGVGVAVAMSNGSGQINKLKEQPAAVYISEVEAGTPKGEQLETLPPAPQAQQTAPVADVKPQEPIVAQTLPEKVEEKKPVAPVVEKQLPQKKAPTKVVTQTLPAKKGKAAQPESNVKAALVESRAEDVPSIDTADQKDEATGDDEANQFGAAALAPVASEDESTSAMTAPVESEQAAPPDETEAPAMTDETSAPQASLAPAPAAAVAPAPSRASDTLGSAGGRGAKAASAEPYGIRDAKELKEGAGNPKPVYPDNDRLARNQGVAVFVAKVRPDGTVTDIRFEKQTSSKSLNESAFSAMKNWRFLPGQEGWVRKSFTFSLGGDAQEMPARLRR